MPAKNFTDAAARATAFSGKLTALTLAALLVTFAPTETLAGGSANVSCARAGSSVNCTANWNGGAGGFPLIVQIPSPRMEREQAESAERERRWAERCQPIVRYDRYGVGRYFYAAAGCEFGRVED